VRQQEFKSLLLHPNTEVRVKVNDGRVIHGIFSCMDSDLNIILDTAVEYYGNHEIDADFCNEDIVRRDLGLAMIAGHHIQRIFVKEGDNLA
jgi:small nuclear ribonucleoprotein (snRNP)-like protein